MKKHLIQKIAMAKWMRNFDTKQRSIDKVGLKLVKIPLHIKFPNLNFKVHIYDTGYVTSIWNIVFKPAKIIAPIFGVSKVDPRGLTSSLELTSWTETGSRFTRIGDEMLISGFHIS